MRSRMVASVVVAFALAALVSVLAVDRDHGDLVGIVTDSGGTRLPGVTVTASGPERRSVVTNQRGEFAFVNLLPGVYEVEHVLSGFARLTRTVTVSASAVQRVQAEMRVGSPEETMTVTGDPPASMTAFDRGAPAQPRVDYWSHGVNTESYGGVEEGGLKRTTADPLSTFSIDVDTASYANVVPAGLEGSDPSSVDPLKYQRPVEPTRQAESDELMTIKVRFKAPDGDASRLVATVLRNRPRSMTANIGFASAVAEFGMLLGDSAFAGSGSYESVAARARAFRGDDPEGYRAEFVRLAELAGSLRTIRAR